MTKRDIVTDIYRETGMPRIVVSCLVDAFLRTLRTGIVEGRTIEIRGFGTFSVQRRKSKPACNPRTGERIMIGARTVPVLRFCPSLREAVARE